MINAAPQPLCPPGKHPVSFAQEPGGVSKLVWKHTEYLAPPPHGFIPQGVQPTVFHHTDYNIPDAY